MNPISSSDFWSLFVTFTFVFENRSNSVSYVPLSSPHPPTLPFPPPDIYFGLKDTWSLNKMYPFVYQKFLEISYHEDTKIHDFFFEVRRKS